MKRLKDIWFPSKPAPMIKAVPVPEDNDITRYKLTDEGLQALVDGKLSCTKISDGRVRASGTFLVEYDSIVFDPMLNRMSFVWNNVEVMRLDVPKVTHGNTLTVAGLQGRLELSIST